MKYLLDTNILIFCLRNSSMMDKLVSQQHEVAISIFSHYELTVGVEKIASKALKEKHSGQVETLLSGLKILPFDSKESICAAQVRVSLERKGIKIGAVDNLLAGTALAHKLTLISDNTKEFSRVRGLEVKQTL